MTMEQWRKAEQLRIYEVKVSREIECFQHFSHVEIMVKQVDYAYLMEWKEKFLEHRHLQSVKLHPSWTVNQDKFKEIFGDYPEPTYANFVAAYCLIEVPDSEEVIRITWYYRYSSVFVFQRMKSSDILPFDNYETFERKRQEGCPDLMPFQLN
ncbi:hypothetical protein CAEBREN_06759 [Caenorhabditis brenneri]|uniref:DUF38 domain-containing protein n=1 Tax=Caenorhabditis brenneri TaxID=135651 RepID=G0MFY4_CAEBE|nr:hypothetical protein CAEBREN_06759 [Caenorhabditis brenneri]